MSDKTIRDIRSAYSARLVAAQRDRDARIREITAMSQPEADPFLLSRLDDGQRAALLQEQKLELAEDDRRARLAELGRALS